MPTITVECIDTLDPKVVRVTVSVGGTPVYAFDVPSALYNALALANGWPSDPCA